jgi:hemoglobin
MQRKTRWPLVFSGCLAMLLSGGASAQDPDHKSDAKARDRSALHESIHRDLRGIIDHGANLYNQGDWNGCYRLWEGALMGLRPVLGERRLRSWAKTIDTDAYGDALKNLQSQLGNRPQLKDVIEAGLTNARQAPQLYRRAFVLRVVLDQLRAETRSAVAAKPDDDNQAIASPEQNKKTLWGRLGGEEGVTRLVDDFVNLASNDPKVDFFRQNKVKLDADHIVKMKREFVEQISQATGGPLKYTGPDMKKVHQGMGITDKQFDAAVADLRKALEKNKVAAEDRKTILDAVERYRKEIVQPKKSEEKKSEEKKPDEKKPQEKKEGKNAGDTARIEGKVTYQGKPLVGGWIDFFGKEEIGEDGEPISHSFSARIAADGSYALTRVKPGEYKISISTVSRRGKAKIPQVPAKYSDPEKSGLILTVRDGKQTYDVNLK